MSALKISNYDSASVEKMTEHIKNFSEEYAQLHQQLLFKIQNLELLSQQREDQYIKNAANQENFAQTRLSLQEEQFVQQRYQYEHQIQLLTDKLKDANKLIDEKNDIIKEKEQMIVNQKSEHDRQVLELKAQLFSQTQKIEELNSLLSGNKLELTHRINVHETNTDNLRNQIVKKTKEYEALFQKYNDLKQVTTSLDQKILEFENNHIDHHGQLQDVNKQNSDLKAYFQILLKRTPLEWEVVDIELNQNPNWFQIALRNLKKASESTTQIKLHLKRNEIQSEQFNQFLSNFKNLNLKRIFKFEIDFRRNEISDQGITSLCQMLNLEQFTHLYSLVICFRINNISNQGLLEMQKFLTPEKFKFLHFIELDFQMNDQITKESQDLFKLAIQTSFSHIKNHIDIQF